MNKNSRPNKSILFMIYIVVFFCMLMIAYMAYFIIFKSESVINSSYNARLDSFSEKVIRGSIQSSDKTVLAGTVTDSDGSEKRYYTYDALFSHAVGYSTRGKTGLESVGDYYLLTSHVNPTEKIYKEISGEKVQGDSIITTLDISLQQAAYDALGDRKGAVAVIEPDTGKILAMVSKPDYNPNLITEKWDDLINSETSDAVLLNRVTQGLYPPGSTFKLLTALEYKNENPDSYNEYTYTCNGSYQYDGYTIKCYHQNAHGEQTLEQAFANSCNGAFAEIGILSDSTKLKALAVQLLYNSNLPLSMEYKKSSYTMDASADTWEKLQTSIGQGYTQISPMHNLLITAAIANGGILMKPYMISSVENAYGETVKNFYPEVYDEIMSAEDSLYLTGLMERVVTDGTASVLKNKSYQAAGKTGSAEFEAGKETHAWFIGFAPAKNPSIAVCVLVEEGGSGGSTAAPIAAAVFDAFFQ